MIFSKQMKTENINVLVRPNCRTNSIEGLHDGRLKVKISAVAEKGKANKELIKFLSKKLNIPKSNIALISGTNNRKKKISIMHDSDVSVIEKLLLKN